MATRFSLVIFDSDGVLVDSEGLGTRVLVDYGREFGLQMDLAEAIPLFRGRKMADCIAEMAGRASRPFPDDFMAQFRARSAVAFRQELQPIPGVPEALAQIHIPVCVASNGPREKMTLALEVTGLLPRFADHLFSAYELGSWKPAPDLYLHAATAFGVPPTSCAVVEDSALGVQAGIAAGMTVFGYTPDAQYAKELAAAGAITFTRMSELPAILSTT